MASDTIQIFHGLVDLGVLRRSQTRRSDDFDDSGEQPRI